MIMRTLFGKYKAVVVNVQDPQKCGRIKVSCPELFGKGVSGWCSPCVPVGGDSFGDFCLPPLGEAVWIEFERGNINSPIYSGGWYSPDKTPIADYANAQTQRIISFGDVTLTLTNGNLQMQVGEKVINFNSSLIDKLEALELLPENMNYFFVQEETT